MSESSRHFQQEELFAHIDEAIRDNELVMRGLYTVVTQPEEDTRTPGQIGAVEVLGFRADADL